MNWTNDNCPICELPAEEALPRMGDFAEFICDDCGRYRITGTALETIRTKDITNRRALLERAKAIAAAEGKHIPEINSYL